MNINDLKGKKVAVWGLGREGWSALRILGRSFPDQEITVLKDDPFLPGEMEKLGCLGRVKVLAGKEMPRHLPDFEVVIKSPGVSRYRPEIKRAESGGVIFTSTTNLWFSGHGGEKTVCVTGTKGKSTTSMLISLLLREAGLKVELGGNIGRSLLDLEESEPRPEAWVIELSSYQTSDFRGETFIGLLLNLYPEHLDWHGGIENYFKDKLNLFHHINKKGFSVINRLDKNTMLSGFDWTNPLYFNDPGGIHFINGYIRNKKEPLINIEDISLLGRHNLSNICAALTVAGCFGIDLKKCLPVLSRFRGLPHRLSRLGEKAGLLFVDDSISTTPESAMAAVEVFPDRPLTLLLGGFDRGLDYGPLASFLAQKPSLTVITLPDSGPKIAEKLRRTVRARGKNHSPRIYEAEDLVQAVALAKSLTPEGGVVLLSPAAPSYGRFSNFEERGEVFARAAGFGRKQSLSMGI